VNDNVEVDLENTLIMHCIHCYQNLVIGMNPKTRKRMCHKCFLKDIWFVSCQKQLTYLICGKYLAQMFGSTYLSKIKLPIQKEIFTRHITNVSGEGKLIICCFALAKCYSTTTSFNLWMSKRTYDVFALVINFLSSD
jgi:hypothetical protein